MNGQKSYQIKTYDDYKVTHWSGGTSTQLHIFPPESSVEKRDFEFRISTASVLDDESDFTIFPGIKRILIPLNNPIVLNHDKGEDIVIQPLTTYSFEGGCHTHCRGKTNDFNLMIRHDREGSLQVVHLHTNEQITLEPHCFAYCVTGEMRVEKDRLTIGQTLHAHQKTKLIAVDSALLILVELRK